MWARAKLEILVRAKVKYKTSVRARLKLIIIVKVKAKSKTLVKVSKNIAKLSHTQKSKLRHKWNRFKEAF